MAMGKHYFLGTVLLLLAAVFVTVDDVAGAGAGDGFITWEDLSIRAVAAPRSTSDDTGGGGGKAGAGAGEHRTIVVSPDGTGHSRTVQGSVDMVPDGNKRRIKILVRPGEYR